MQRAVCTLCTSFGSWTFFGLFPFKGSAYGAYGCIRMTMESGLIPTARRHWSLFGPRKPKVHTAVHTAFRPKSPIDPLLSERRDSFGMASEPMDGIRPCGPLQGPFRGLPAVRRIGTVPAAEGALERRTHSMRT